MRRAAGDLPGPDGVRVYVGGQTAELIDTTHAIGTRLPLAALLIVLTTFIVLFLFTGSVVQPIRSFVLNGVTLAATAAAGNVPLSGRNPGQQALCLLAHLRPVPAARMGSMPLCAIPMSGSD